jgi:hypothetical protein
VEVQDDTIENSLEGLWNKMQGHKGHKGKQGRTFMCDMIPPLTTSMLHTFTQPMDMYACDQERRRRRLAHEPDHHGRD